ncbi:MAG: CaiB/BaiF CoA transferase family protein [Halanaeroarchaeum sp.]
MTATPLSGVTVLDLTRLLPGPYGTQLLGDLGADVVKIEEPTRGDYYREETPRLDDGDSRIFALLNRNKRSVALDLKDERGHRAFLDLAADADVIVEQFRPGVADRLGVDVDSVREVNDAVVYVSLSGYGQGGPYEQWVGHDINYIGIGGLLGMTGEPDEKPTLPGLPVADFAGGMATAVAALAGVVQAGTTGEGSYFDVSMTDVMVSWQSLYAPFVFDDEAAVPDRGGTMPAGKYPCYDVYETADGEYLTVGAMEYKFWEALCTELGLEEYANRDDHMPAEPRRTEIRESLAAVFRERTREEWLETLDPSVVPVAPVNDLEAVWEDPQVEHREMVESLSVDGESMPFVSAPFEIDGESAFVREPHPGLGEHSRQILHEMGYDRDEIDRLVADGVTVDPASGD